MAEFLMDSEELSQESISGRQDKEVFPVFLNGEMLNREIAVRVLGGEWEQEALSLTGYKTRTAPWGKAYVEKKEDGCAEGMLAWLKEDQLWRLDQWKDIPVFRRNSVKRGKNEDTVFTYFRSGQRMEVAEEGTVTELVLGNFEKKLSLGGSRKSDLFLMYPCAVSKHTDDSDQEVADDFLKSCLETKEGFYREDEDTKELWEFFLEKLKQYNHEEFEGLFFRQISRKPLGIVKTVISLEGEDFFQYGFAFASVHPQTGVAMMGLTLLSLSVPAELELCGFCSDELNIVTEGRKRVTAGEWMRQQGLTLYGSPKAILFSYSPMEQDEIIHCLACEMLPMGNLMGEELVRWSQENFAQYDIARVYASDRCLLEISQMKGEILTERLNLEAVELFFLELLMMQEAAIARVSDRTYDLFREGLYREDSSGSQEKLFSLSQEAASAVLFVNFKKLRFPTVRISFKKIAERFGIAEGLENYQTCREMLEQMIAINTAEAEKADGDLMNLLLLFLTMMQVLPVFADLVRYMMGGQWNLVDIISSLGGAAGCLTLYILYRVAFRRRQKRFMERRFSQK
ncbi:MAG: hypothetical protein HFG66_06160 [Hungatella sp.]|nr:hypothetical protein [Hungatella sp.]